LTRGESDADDWIVHLFAFSQNGLPSGHRICRFQPVCSRIGGGVVIVHTASPEKHDLIRQLGGAPIDYRQEDFVEKIRQHHPDGIDCAFDGLGWRSFKRSIKTIKPGGMFSEDSIIAVCVGW
jgi:threonine dehydrogenase-like Zn-dependent dehydrogenase